VRISSFDVTMTEPNWFFLKRQGILYLLLFILSSFSLFGNRLMILEIAFLCDPSLARQYMPTVVYSLEWPRIVCILFISVLFCSWYVEKECLSPWKVTFFNIPALDFTSFHLSRRVVGLKKEPFLFGKINLQLMNWPFRLVQ
jgi:hypothetical protein